MAASKLFLTSSDISSITGMSIRAAQNMLNMFEQRGRTVRCGNSKRGQMVDINFFVRYLCEQDGADPKVRKKDVMDCLNARRNETVVV